MEKKLFRGIDLAKFVASFLVVALHFPPLADLSGDLSVLLTNGVTRIAVPFFFCCSGFFL